MFLFCVSKRKVRSPIKRAAEAPLAVQGYLANVKPTGSMMELLPQGDAVPTSTLENGVYKPIKK